MDMSPVIVFGRTIKVNELASGIAKKSLQFISKITGSVHKLAENKKKRKELDQYFPNTELTLVQQHLFKADSSISAHF